MIRPRLLDSAYIGTGFDTGGPSGVGCGGGLGGGYTFRVCGSSQIASNLTVTGTFSNASDARLKRNIQSLPYGLNEVLRLRPVSWQWRNQPDGRA
jgi:hypothetical protein